MRKLIYLVLLGFALTVFAPDVNAKSAKIRALEALIEYLKGTGKHVPELPPPHPTTKPPPSTQGQKPPFSEGLDLDDPLGPVDPRMRKAEDPKSDVTLR